MRRAGCATVAVRAVVVGFDYIAARYSAFRCDHQLPLGLPSKRPFLLSMFLCDGVSSAFNFFSVAVVVAVPSTWVSTVGMEAVGGASTMGSKVGWGRKWSGAMFGRGLDDKRRRTRTTATLRPMSLGHLQRADPNW
jgi:hypothetical protein